MLKERLNWSIPHLSLADSTPLLRSDGFPLPDGKALSDGGMKIKIIPPQWLRGINISKFISSSVCEVPAFCEQDENDKEGEPGLLFLVGSIKYFLIS